MPDNLSQPIAAAPLPNPAPTPPTPPITLVAPIASPPPVLKKEPKRIKTLLAIFILFILSGSVPLAVLLTRQRQEVRKEAAAGGWVSTQCSGSPGETKTGTVVKKHFNTLAECQALCCGTKCGDMYYCGQGTGNPISCTIAAGQTSCTISAQETCGVVQVDCQGGGGDITHECAGCPVAPTATPSLICPVNITCCYSPLTTCTANDQCPTNYKWCYAGFCIKENYHPDTNTCVGTTPTTTPIPSGTPRPTPTPTTTPIPSGTPRPTATPTQPSYSLSCTTCRVYDTNWNQISNLSSIQSNQTVYFATQGSTDHPQGITKAQFRINGGNWQETTNTHSGLFYIQFTVPSPGSYTVESMVYNPALGWY